MKIHTIVTGLVLIILFAVLPSCKISNTGSPTTQVSPVVLVTEADNSYSFTLSSLTGAAYAHLISKQDLVNIEKVRERVESDLNAAEAAAISGSSTFGVLYTALTNDLHGYTQYQVEFSNPFLTPQPTTKP